MEVPFLGRVKEGKGYLLFLRLKSYVQIVRKAAYKLFIF